MNFFYHLIIWVQMLVQQVMTVPFHFSFQPINIRMIADGGVKYELRLFMRRADALWSNMRIRQLQEMSSRTPTIDIEGKNVLA
jgi:hypothetical protein